MNVYAEFDGDQVVRIFKKAGQAKRSDAYPDRVRFLPKREAVGNLRDEVFRRTEGNCQNCGKYITKETMHMHEKVSRGRGGEYSLENSVGICYDCHLGPGGAHPERQLNFSRGASGQKSS